MNRWGFLFSSPYWCASAALVILYFTLYIRNMHQLPGNPFRTRM